MGRVTRTSVGELCAELDALEALTGERPGGATEAEYAAMRSLEDSIGEEPADGPAVLLWRVRRLTRAVINDWRPELLLAVAFAVERDIDCLTAKRETASRLGNTVKPLRRYMTACMTEEDAG